jgi:DNA-binding NarL/FixJ family response regulator
MLSEKIPVPLLQKSISPRRVLIVDDHPILRHGVAQTLGAEPDLRVGAEANGSGEALVALRTEPMDLAIVDVCLVGTNGIELIKQIRGEHPHLPILVLSMHDEALYALRALRAGAAGYIMKREAPERLIEAVRKVLSGQIYVSTAVSQQLAQAPLAPPSDGPRIDLLTDRELEVLHLVGEAQNTRQIARHLNLSVKTIESHRLNIKDKLVLRSPHDLIRFAVEWVRAQTG